MANPIKGEVQLKLKDGREFVLVADHAALVKGAQAHTGGTKLNRLMSDMQPEVDEKGIPIVDEYGDPVKDTMPATAAFLFGLFDAHHPNVSQRDALNMLLAEPDVVSEAISRAVEAGFPDAVEGKESTNPQATGRASKSSGGSGAKRG